MTASLLLLSLLACSDGPFDAPYGSTLTLPADVQFSMDAGLVVPDDGYGHLFFGDVIVTGSDATQDRDIPLNNIKVEVFSGWSGAYIVPEEAVTIVTSYEDACAELPDDSEDPCKVYFDDENEYYVEFAGDYADLGGFRPTYYSGGTDNTGTLRVYIFVDTVPLDGNGEPVLIPVWFTITGTTESMSLTALSGAGSDATE